MGASSQPESNEHPITAYEKREDFCFFFFLRAVPKPWRMLFFFSIYNCKEDPLSTPPKKKLGGAFTVHAKLIWMVGGFAPTQFEICLAIHAAQGKSISFSLIKSHPDVSHDAWHIRIHSDSSAVSTILLFGYWPKHCQGWKPCKHHFLQ